MCQSATKGNTSHPWHSVPGLAALVASRRTHHPPAAAGLSPNYARSAALRSLCWGPRRPRGGLVKAPDHPAYVIQHMSSSILTGGARPKAGSPSIKGKAQHTSPPPAAPLAGLRLARAAHGGVAGNPCASLGAPPAKLHLRCWGDKAGNLRFPIVLASICHPAYVLMSFSGANRTVR